LDSFSPEELSRVAYKAAATAAASSWVMISGGLVEVNLDDEEQA